MEQVADVLDPRCKQATRAGHPQGVACLALARA